MLEDPMDVRVKVKARGVMISWWIRHCVCGLLLVNQPIYVPLLGCGPQADPVRFGKCTPTIKLPCRCVQLITIFSFIINFAIYFKCMCSTSSVACAM